MIRRVVCDATRAGALLGLGLFALAPAATAEDWKWKWSNGFKLDSADSAFKLKFGGRLQADYTFADPDDTISGVEDGFEFRRARLFFSGTIYERIEFKAQYDFADGGAEIKDLWLAIKQAWGQVRFGHYKEYFSIEEQTSSKYIAFIERSTPVEAFSPGRNSGVGLHGKKGDTFNWGVGVFYDADDFGESANEDRLNITARAVFRPVYEDKGKRLFHIGVSASQKDLESGGTFRYRSRPEAHFSSRFVNTSSIDADSAWLLDLELAGVFGPFWFQSEWIQSDVDSNAADDPTFDGFYVQAGYYLTGEHRRYKTSSGAFDRQKPSSSFGKDGGKGAWEIAVRYSTLDLIDEAIEGGELDTITLALNWYLNPATRLMINYITADADIGDSDFLLVRWQVDF